MRKSLAGWGCHRRLASPNADGFCRKFALETKENRRPGKFLRPPPAYARGASPEAENESREVKAEKAERQDIRLASGTRNLKGQPEQANIPKNEKDCPNYAKRVQSGEKSIMNVASLNHLLVRVRCGDDWAVISGPIAPEAKAAANPGVGRKILS